MSDETIFAAALEKADPAERTVFLDRACPDAAARERIERLLAAHDQAGAFMQRPAVAPEGFPTVTQAPDGDGEAEPDDALAFLTPSARPDALGRIGHYDVLQVLGKGAFGIVFRAFDDVLQRVVAVKVMAPLLAATSPARKRFLREARSSAQVRHENVVQVYEVAEQPLPYIAMEFIPGETLQERLNRLGPVDAAEVVRVGRQIAEGLAAAHASDLIHRDIKPGNVLIEGGQNRVKITDFGLARAADDASISQSGIIAGTPMYMAPEQALGQKLDQRADLFSLGSVLYQMAAGRPPFRANGTVAVLKRVAEDTPRDIREVIPETPQWLCDIIAKLHAKNPDDRYQSAREVADVLADCEAQLKANSKLKDYSRIPRGPRPARRWKWGSAVAVVLLLPLAVLAVTEFAGLTQLLRSPQPTAADGPKVDPNVNAPPPPVAGRFALAFDGQSNVVRVPTLTIENDHALTAEAWAVLERPALHPQSENLLGTFSNGGFGLAIPPAREGREGKKWAFSIRLKETDRYARAWESQPVPRGQLVHVAGVYDGTAEIRFYVNGQLQSRTPAQKVKPSVKQLTLGNSPQDVSPFFGRINGVRISKVVRYDADFAPAQRWEPDADTLALYHFDEGEGLVLKDSSGNGHHGEIVGAKWVKADGSPLGSPPASEPPAFTNGVGMEFVVVPKGKAWLGGGDGIPGDREVDIPADFYLGKYEVTQEEWQKVMEENPSHFSRTGAGMDAVKGIEDADLKRFPVENVSWDQCQVFVAKLNEREKETGWVYRLPTETEWEYTCRGGPMADKADSAFDFYFARPTNTLSSKEANIGGDNWLNRTCQVGSYEPNRLGLFDMHGNVWEWCVDDGKAEDGTWEKVSRGGCWTSAQPKHYRATTRITSGPSSGNVLRGLRLARVAAGAPSPEAKAPPADLNGWKVLKPAEMKSEGGATLKLQADDSVLVSGTHPDKDTYTLTVRDLPARIHSLRLEALPHDSLPMMGPGRSAEFPFVLSMAKAQFDLPGGKGDARPLTFTTAWDDGGGPGDALPKFALDADDGTGWSTPFGERHEIVFELAEPVAVPAGAVLRVTLEFKHVDVQRQLGCFRLSAAPVAQPRPKE